MVPVSLVDVEVTDGGPLADCAVSLSPSDLGAHTDANGRAQLELEHVGAVTVSLRCAGHEPMDVDLYVAEHRALHLRVTPPVAGVHPARVAFMDTILAVVPRIDVSEGSTTGMVLTKEFLEHVPTGRSYQSAVTLAREASPPRAGSTDDNADLRGFLRFVGSWTDRPDMEGRWAPLDVRDQVWVRVLDAEGAPRVGAHVLVRDEAGHAVLDGTTQGDGQVPFRPWLDGDGPASTYRVEVDEVSRDWTPRADLVVATDAPHAAPDRVPVDVVLILDTTGSMGDELATLTGCLRDVVQRLERDLGGVDLRIGVVSYRDRGDLYVTDVLFPTADLGVVDDTLRGTHAKGGGDTEESLNEALAVAARLPYRPEAARVAFLLADAPPHMDYADDLPYDQGVRRAVAAGLRVHTVAASGLDDVGSLVFRQIAQFTHGRFLFLEYEDDLAASAADHGVEGQVEANTLDHLLYDLVRAEVVGYGR
ncbi:MAG: VWA domain-containing protein [Alphaproteobacteria bacterium]|nr:VWA domain-containing protein [Alphaproteobacteria bacterium]